MVWSVATEKANSAQPGTLGIEWEGKSVCGRMWTPSDESAKGIMKWYHNLNMWQYGKVWTDKCLDSSSEQ